VKKLFLLLSLLFFSLTACFIFKPDFFSGEWKFFINSSGEEVPDNDLAFGLIISKTDVFYNVEVLLPKIPEVKEPEQQYVIVGYSYKYTPEYKKYREYINTINGLEFIKQKYTGKYTLSEDRKTITHLNGNVSFQYKKEGDILYTKDFGCFKKGKALLELPKPKEELKK